MKVAVIGASGMMGSKIVRELERNGLDVIPASTKTGVDAYTGQGLQAALAGVDVVIDVTNSGSFGEGNALDFFRQSGKNLLKAAKSLGVKHYMALSVVGTEWMVENDYFRAKLVQENLIRSSGLSYTIVRSTQFFEVFSSIVNESGNDGGLQLPPIAVQPISADEAASWIARLAGEDPHNSLVELAGPEPIELVDLARELLTANEDGRPIATDPAAQYFGVTLAPESLLPIRQTITGRLSFHDWLSRAITR